MPDSTEHNSVPPTSRSTSRTTKIVLWFIAALVAIPAIALVILLNYDWNKARPWLNAKTSEAIGRPFAINGDLSLKWEKPAAAINGRDATWRDHIPWPHLIANDVHISNPAGMPARDMASVRQLSFSLNPFSLLHKQIVIPVLRFEAPAVDLVRNADGANNWSFHHQDKPSPWTLDLERVVFTKGVVHLADAVEKADVTADVDTINADPSYGIGWKLRGTYNGAPVSGGGKAGAVLSLKEQTVPYPIQADFRMGLTRISAEGTITRPAKLAAIDLKLKLAGASMARLYNLIGVLLPETPAFSTEGRLIGTLDANSSRWTYDKFKGKVGKSDIGGRLEFQTGKPRGMLTGDVVSHLLNFSDLAPLIGADSNASKAARGVAPVQPPGKVLPVETFKTERWKTVDADVKFSAERIMREKQLPLSKLTTHLVMKAGVLTLNPLNFTMAGGNMVSNIKLDGSGREGKDAIKATAKVTARHLKIKELFPTIEKMQATVGEVNGDASLSGTGNSIATIMASANGELKTLINQGSVSKLLLEEMGLNIGNIVLTKLFGDKPVQLNCMATDFGVTSGLMQTRVFVVDTDEAVITADGTVNLNNEQLNLTLRPQTKALRIFSLRAPLHLRGTFSNPDVSVDKGVLALKAGGAAALAVAAAPIAALVPLINTGPGQDSACGQLLAAARVKPVAPPPPAHAKR
jgi:uncharacterized protein involved in outer membrane biogenesis